MLEVPAGLIDSGEDPKTAVLRELREETGYSEEDITDFKSLNEGLYASPGYTTEKLYFFIAEYSPDDRQTGGGGLAEEGEDIEVLEWPLEQALQAIRDGEIVDAKTIMLLQHLALNSDSLLAAERAKSDTV